MLPESLPRDSRLPGGVALPPCSSRGRGWRGLLRCDPASRWRLIRHRNRGCRRQGEVAAFIALLRYSVRAYLAIGMSLAEALAHTNDLLLADLRVKSTATALIGELDSRTGRFTYANDGHELPVSGSPIATSACLPGTDLMLGVLPDQRYATRITSIKPRDCCYSLPIVSPNPATRAATFWMEMARPISCTAHYDSVSIAMPP